jgi:2,3-bisphosphoglycerate-dependent phosphoglycerate mutase
MQPILTALRRVAQLFLNLKRGDQPMFPKAVRNVLLLTLVISCFGVLDTALAQSESKLTTFILVRHAEKESDGTKDPALTEKGQERANRLAALLKRTQISAIYSTPFQRTRQTIRPLATEQELSIAEYDPFDKELLGKLLATYSGGCVVLSGHSNTTPALVNRLIGEERFDQLSEDDYGNIFIVTVTQLGTGTVTRLRF